MGDDDEKNVTECDEDLVMTTPETTTFTDKNKKRKKRKRDGCGLELTKEEREAHIKTLSVELEGLFSYFHEVLNTNKPTTASPFRSENTGLNHKVALLLEESQLPLSKLVNHIKSHIADSNVTVLAVKTSVLSVGQRVVYGLPNPDADILEDDSDSSLWCWETRDMKLIPKSARDVIKIRRTCRKKIHDRITAVSAMVTELNKVDNERDLHKTSEKLSKVLTESDIRVLVQGLFQKQPVGLSEKPEDKLAVKDFEKNIRECEKEKMRMERQLHKEKLQREKELKRLQEEAEKDEKRREREESEMKKLVKKQQEEAEKDQRRREKEEAEKKKQLSIKKQASIMERFLKRNKIDSCRNDCSSAKLTRPSLLSTKSENPGEAVTQSMDCAFSSDGTVSVDDIFRSHLSSWRQIGRSLHLNKKLHWGIRKKPKTQLVKELRLGTSRGLVHDDECSMEKLEDVWEEENPGDRSCVANAISYPPYVRNCNLRRQLLQFDKCHRPAFYGIWPKKSNVVGPRCPLKKDPDLDYDIDSDEEWEEEEPGESLSDCDKEEDESLEGGCSKVDDGDESDDGFLVPDGYLSEDEGVQVDKMKTDICAKVAKSSSCKQSAESVGCAMLQQQENLNDLTERALRKNQPLIIVNLRHEKALIHEETSSVSKLEQCLLALSMHVYPGGPPIEISTSNVQDDDQENCSINRKEGSTPVSTASGVDESDLPTIVSAIQSCPQGINKVVESLQEKFPTTPKSQLRNKVREVSDFVDNRWQVKKNILDKLGLSPSPEKGGARTKSIATFFSKRCMPPTDETITQKH